MMNIVLLLEKQMPQDCNFVLMTVLRIGTQASIIKLPGLTVIHHYFLKALKW